MVEEERNKDYPMGTTPREHRQTRHNNALSSSTCHLTRTSGAGLQNQRRLMRALACGHRLAYDMYSKLTKSVGSRELTTEKAEVCLRDQRRT